MLKLPQFTLPAVVARVAARLPSHPPAFLLTRALDFGIDRIVPRQAIEPLVGRRFVLVVRDLGLALHFRCTPKGFRPTSARAAPELSIAATLRDFIALGLREEDPDTLFFARRLAIEGDTELGLIVKNALDGIDWPAIVAQIGRSVPGVGSILGAAAR